MALEQEVKVYQSQLAYGEMLLEGLAADKAFELICDGGVNPAWIMGHLGLVANNITAMAGGQPKIDVEQWKPLFGGGTTPATDASAYPAWDELVSVWKQGHADVADAIPSISEEVLSGENPIELLRPILMTTHDFLSFALTAHESMHMGQLSTWRRVQGQPPLF
ncbi:MAG: DinB family protein [Planctomycetota bacterium]